MHVYAGIDEAGYGPLLGPLVVSMTVFRLHRFPSDQAPPCLWELLEEAVCRRPRDASKRVAVNDSKLLAGSGIRHLERGVLAFLAASGHRPHSLGELLGIVRPPGEPVRPTLPWYEADSGEPALPADCAAGAVASSAHRLASVFGETAVELAGVAAAPVFADRLNSLIHRTDSKAAAAWTFVGAHLHTLWERFGAEGPTVVVDRQGGRKCYRHQLASLFAGASFEVHEESSLQSRYGVRGDGRTMTIIFAVKSEADHLPAALASMASKYLRELFMMRFRRFWARHAPEVRPTRGYVTDGRRFLREIAPALDRLRIDRDTLVRCR